jgi:hypothetical protein
MRHSETLDKLAMALVQARGKMRPIHKDASNPHFRNSYASLAAISEAATPALLEQGVMVIQSGGAADEAGTEVITRLQHVSGEWIETSVRMPMDKATAQGAGSALTYGRRYGLSAALGIVADDDDDGNAASARGAWREQSSAPRSAIPAPRSESGPVIPFGKTKGTTLSAMSDDDLQSALSWAQAKGSFTEFQAQAEAELTRRRGGTGGVASATTAAIDEALAALPEAKQTPARRRWIQRRDKGVSDAEAQGILASIQSMATGTPTRMAG